MNRRERAPSAAWEVMLTVGVRMLGVRILWMMMKVWVLLLLLLLLLAVVRVLEWRCLIVRWHWTRVIPHWDLLAVGADIDRRLIIWDHTRIWKRKVRGALLEFVKVWRGLLVVVLKSPSMFEVWLVCPLLLFLLLLLLLLSLLLQ